jgi:hypothetical protein
MSAAAKWHASPTHNGQAYDIGADDGANIALVYGPKDGGREDFARVARTIAALAPVAMETADGFLVVSRRRACKSVIPPYRHDYSYDHFDHLADAEDFYHEVADGEYGQDREARAIVPCLRGVPLGSKVLP